MNHYNNCDNMGGTRLVEQIGNERHLCDTQISSAMEELQKNIRRSNNSGEREDQTRREGQINSLTSTGWGGCHLPETRACCYSL